MTLYLTCHAERKIFLSQNSYQVFVIAYYEYTEQIYKGR